MRGILFKKINSRYVNQEISHLIQLGVIGITPRYWLDGPGFQSRWEGEFPDPSRPASRTTQSPVLWGPSLFPGGKAAGAWR
jgi:hypothetical protein